MKTRRRLISFILLNILVSAATMLLILSIWSASFPNNSQNPVSLGGGEDNSGAAAPQDNAPISAASGQLEITRVVGAGDLASERIEILHVGEQEIVLEGWSLVDEQGNQYFFPNLKLASQGSVIVFTKAGMDIVVELYWGLDGPVWESGEVATLLDPSGTAQATYTVP